MLTMIIKQKKNDVIILFIVWFSFNIFIIYAKKEKIISLCKY